MNSSGRHPQLSPKFILMEGLGDNLVSKSFAWQPCGLTLMLRKNPGKVLHLYFQEQGTGTNLVYSESYISVRDPVSKYKLDNVEK